ncbi:hypothetical protein M9H77_25740 [Catharanthus roseus]|uniref:Uncharacterized protein n=1 Tax=Catharanthus roseus TaxID=4058 RepID=A0ACC0A920_CATRO|nr:hypothetical protein M9H77_25740 [Catharanthus roseus]
MIRPGRYRGNDDLVLSRTGQAEFMVALLQLHLEVLRGDIVLLTRTVNGTGLTRTRAGKKKYHTGTSIPKPYPGPWRVESGSRNFIPGGYGSGSGSKFHYKGIGFHHGIGAPGSSYQPPVVPFRFRPPFQPHLSYTPVPYEAIESAHPESSHTPDTVYDPYLHAPTIRPRIQYRSAAQEPILEFNGQLRQIGIEFFYQMVGAAPHDSSCSTHGYSHADFGVYILHIEGEADEGGDDGGDDNEDEGEDSGDKEQPMPVTPIAYASVSDGRPRNVKGLIGSFMSMMSKISGSCNKRPDVARNVLAPT